MLFRLGLKMRLILLWGAFLQRVLMAHSNRLKSPFKYFFVVTKKCGSRCMYCKIWKENPEGELLVEDYQKIARSINKKLSWLNITGGEPTDRNDLPEIISAFKNECPNLLFVNFTSNGLNPEHLQNFAEKIEALQVPYVVINVSLDGPPEVNDKIRGVEGSFTKVMDSYVRLKNIKGLKTKLALTLYPQNVELIEETYQAAKRIYAPLKRSDMHLNVPHQSEHYYGNSQVKINTSDYASVLTAAIRKFRNKTGISGILSGVNLMEHLYQKKIPEYFSNKKSPLVCQALQSSVYISEKGMVYPCTIWNKPLGNMSDYGHDLSAIAKSETYQKARQEILRKHCPNCWTPCEAFTSILGSIPQALRN